MNGTFADYLIVDLNTHKLSFTNNPRALSEPGYQAFHAGDMADAQRFLMLAHDANTREYKLDGIRVRVCPLGEVTYNVGDMLKKVLGDLIVRRKESAPPTAPPSAASPASAA